MKIYFDNAASTPILPEVLESMMPYLKEVYGNPSSIHAHGRKARAAIEKTRKQIAELLNTSPSEIFFTSGGTEADNFALRTSLESLGVQKFITSPIEHHAVLHPLEFFHKQGWAELDLLSVNSNGEINFQELEEKLAASPSGHTLLSLMHGNNEIGNLLDLQRVSTLCRQYGAYFHSDTVQTVGHQALDLQALDIDFIVGSAHKFHGPKGVGFIYVNANNPVQALLHGGSQERNLRGGTENIYAIVGMGKALELALEKRKEHEDRILGLKQHFITALKENIPGVEFNGLSANLDQSLPTVLSVCLPVSPESDMLLFNLDIEQISASAGSACTSGSDAGSHVLQALNTPGNRASLRFSFSHLNTAEEVEKVIATLQKLYSPETSA